jgi:hypothetical protein
MAGWGRIGSGVVELIASIMILVPRTTVFGAILSVGTIGGAIFAHLTKLGITIPAVDDHQIPLVGQMLFGQINQEQRSKFAA